VEQRTVRKPLKVLAERKSGETEQFECEGYVLITKNQENVVALHGEGLFAANKDYIAMLNCIKMMLGEDRFTMCLAALEAQSCIIYKSGEIVKAGVAG
jgi:hypothetical protein